MQIPKYYQNLDENETQWLVESAALRPDASVEDFIDSFLALFPERATHEGITTEQIREKLTSRFNDILYRKERGYAQTIKEKSTQSQQRFSSVFAVLNPLALLNHYEQIFNNPDSKQSDIFKAIQAAETLKQRIVQEEIDRQHAARKKQIEGYRTRCVIMFNDKMFHSIWDHLDEHLQDEIDQWDMKKMIEVLEREGMTAELQTIRDSIDYSTFDQLSETALDEIYDEYQAGFLREMSFQEYQQRILEALDPLDREFITLMNLYKNERLNTGKLSLTP